MTRIRQSLSLIFTLLLFAMAAVACSNDTTHTTTLPVATTTQSSTATGTTQPGQTTSSTASTTTTSSETDSIVGEYEIDITNLGMPLIFYLEVGSDDTFRLSSDRTFSVDKGHGTVGHSGATYMFIYSDSTLQEPKTSTFTVDNHNLHFSTSLHYGSSNLPASKEDEENPEIIYYLVAKTLQNEDYFGEYVGAHSVTAMASTIDYEYSLTLRSGNEYAFLSQYEVGGEPYEYVEAGFYQIAGTVLTLKPEDNDDIVGSIDSSGAITIGVKPADNAERSEQDLLLAITASCAGVYTGYKKVMEGQTVVYETSVTLVLDKFGGYVYTGVDTISGTIEETGSFTISGSTLSFSPSDSGAPFTGSLVNYQLTTDLFLQDGAETRTNIKLYCQTVQGEFSGEGEDEAENSYTATINLYHDGTFDLVVLDSEENEILSDDGTFEIIGFMLNLVGGEIYPTVVSNVGINVNFEVAPEVEVGFILKKVS